MLRVKLGYNNNEKRRKKINKDRKRLWEIDKCLYCLCGVHVAVMNFHTLYRSASQHPVSLSLNLFILLLLHFCTFSFFFLSKLHTHHQWLSLLDYTIFSLPTLNLINNHYHHPCMLLYVFLFNHPPHLCSLLLHTSISEAHTLCPSKPPPHPLLLLLLSLQTHRASRWYSHAYAHIYNFFFIYNL